jgi:hypothetical protein
MVHASVNFVFNLINGCAVSGGCGTDRRGLGIQFTLPGGSADCSTLAVGLRWNMASQVPIGSVSAHSQTIWEFGGPPFPAANTEGGYIVTSNCATNTALLVLKDTNALYDGMDLNIGINLFYPTY